MLEAKDQEHSRKCSPKKKRSSKIFFMQSPIYRRGQNFRLVGMPQPQITRNDIIKNFQKSNFLWDKDIIGWNV